MQKRININNVEPNAYKAMFGLQSYLDSTDLDANLKELVRIRVSQINGCAYCIQMHTEEARKIGESENKIYALSAWKESPLFTDEERAILTLAEEITLISVAGVNSNTYEKAATLFGERNLAQWIMHIVTINAWNRMAISTKMMHE